MYKSGMLKRLGDRDCGGCFNLFNERRGSPLRNFIRKDLSRWELLLIMVMTWEYFGPLATILCLGETDQNWDTENEMDILVFLKIVLQK